MRVTLSVPEALRGPVDEFIEDEALSIEVVSNGEATVRIVQSSPGRRQSNLETLEAGGWIACTTARAMAARLGMEGRRMGKLLDLLNIKIRQCELGCF